MIQVRRSSGVSPAVHGFVDARKDADIEPVAFHGNSDAFWREVCHQFTSLDVPDISVKFLDLTALSYDFALAAVQLKLSYCGVCQSEVHMKSLQSAMVNQVYSQFTQSTSLLFDPSAVKALSDAAAAGGSGEPEMNNPQVGVSALKREGGAPGPGTGSSASSGTPAKIQRTGTADADPIQQALNDILSGTQPVPDSNQNETPDDDEDPEL